MQDTFGSSPVCLILDEMLRNDFAKYSRSVSRRLHNYNESINGLVLLDTSTRLRVARMMYREFVVNTRAGNWPEKVQTYVNNVAKISIAKYYVKDDRDNSVPLPKGVDVFHVHEILDRAAQAANIVENMFDGHPAMVLGNLSKRHWKIVKKLHAFYQAIGRFS